MLSEAVAVIVIKLPLARIAPDKGKVIVTVGEIVSNSFGVGVEEGRIGTVTVIGVGVGEETGLLTVTVIKEDVPTFAGLALS